MFDQTSRITGHKLLVALRKAGFEVIRIKGSHHFLRHPDGRSTVVPVHRGETLGPGITAQILKDCELTPEELSNLL
jgi:predicted RNA binding protein YcfA (HicA-like mRNA interferase family)